MRGRLLPPHGKMTEQAGKAAVKIKVPPTLPCRHVLQEQSRTSPSPREWGRGTPALLRGPQRGTTPVGSREEGGAPGQVGGRAWRGSIHKTTHLWDPKAKGQVEAVLCAY